MGWSAVAAAAPWRVALFTPRQQDDPFWGQFVRFALQAGADLNVKVFPHYAEGSLPKMRNQIEAAAASEAYDALIFPNFKMGGRAFLEAAEAHEVPAFIVNSGFTAAEQVGNPREGFQYWIGELLPDEAEAGAAVAESLIQQGFQQFHDSGTALEVVGIAGIISDYASTERTQGLVRTLQQYPEVSLRQIVPANWNAEQAAQSFSILKQRFPDVRLVWCASDVMAQGVLTAARQNGLTPGVDLLVGGFDWAETGLRSVANGTQWSSAGGHFLEGGWAIVLVFDYLEGVDFAPLDVRWRSRMETVTHETWPTFSAALKGVSQARLDFRKASRFLHPQQAYDLTVRSVLQEVPVGREAGR